MFKHYCLSSIKDFQILYRPEILKEEINNSERKADVVKNK